VKTDKISINRGSTNLDGQWYRGKRCFKKKIKENFPCTSSVINSGGNRQERGKFKGEKNRRKEIGFLLFIHKDPKGILMNPG
jgi:hypothetical protein